MDPSPACSKIALMLKQRLLALLQQTIPQRHWQRNTPILVALASTHADLTARKVHILDPQAKAFHQSHAGAIQQTRHQCSHTFRDCRQQPGNILHGQNDGQTFGALRTHNVLQPWQFHPQHLAIEEQQRRQRLVLGGWRHLAFGRQPAEECRNLITAHLAGMALSVGQDEPPDPPQIGLLSTDAVVPQTDLCPDTIQQSRRLRRCYTAWNRVITHRAAPKR